MDKCCMSKSWGIIVLILGILFLLQDLNVITFWTVGPWTIVFLVVGLMVVLKEYIK
jgi:membrane-bound ClpP family serine protease